MAQNKKPSQAERAAANSKKSKKAKTTKKAQTSKRKETVHISARLISAAVCLCLFVFNLFKLLHIEGYIPNFCYWLFAGLMGKTAFVFTIPALLYLFCIQAFSGKRPVIMRSLCTIAFVFFVGGIAHLMAGSADFGKGLGISKKLFAGGMDGTTGGMLSGLFAAFAAKLLSVPGAYILLYIAAIVCLLAAVGITIPSLVRAYENRPRGDWEEDEQEERPEPAEVVINHLANKRIEYIERHRQAREDRERQKDIDVPLPGEKKRKKKTYRKQSDDDMMRQIDDIDAPIITSEPQFVPDEDDVDEVFEPLRFPEAAPIPEKEQKKRKPEEKTEAVDLPPWEDADEELLPVMPLKDPALDKVTAQEARASAAQVAAEIEKANAVEKPIYCFPPINLLNSAKRSNADGTAEMQENTRRLNETLASFKIEAHIINVTRGPSVTRYEVELEKGVRLNKLTTVSDDIALSLGASGVRIAAVPDKISVVGIEVPNRAVTTVALREVIDSPEFARAKSKSSFAVGKDIGGACIIGNIAKLPHMLIAGTTGSGKSVCMNSIIISLLYKASPDDVKLIMVDPKMVELGIYNGIPHLLIPVVTDPKKAAGSLQWAVTEMMRRYKAMSDAGVRDLESYNSIMESEEGNKLPQVVVIIDELADLMLVAAKEVEESICRIAQMGRAAGIHLIIATQRPSADVITGLMKANIPSRIAFAVASAMESRIILDTQGAEKLVGRGDMLFAPIGNGKPLRVQGCFVDDEEVEAVANYVKNNYITHYDQTVMDEIEQKVVQSSAKGSAPDLDPTADETAGDEMLPAAVEVILETGQASVSMLQRRLKLGYARAARIVDEMEERGIVGPFKGSKPREILVTKEQWATMNGSGSADHSDDKDFEPVSEDL